METMNISKSTPVYEPSAEIFVEPNDDNGMIVLYVILFIAVMILVAHYAGFNVLSYLGKGIDVVGDKIIPIWETILVAIGYKTEDSVKNVANKTATTTGALGENITKQSEKVKKATQSSDDDQYNSDDDDDQDVDPVDTNQMNGNKKTKQNGTSTSNSENINTSKQSSTSQRENDVTASELNKKINNSQPTRAELEKLESENVKPTDSYESSSSNKKGWCLIGSYEGIRSCSRVGEADTCMSGDIFPSQDICVNPNIRV
jgi:hypothetical protein